MSEATLSQNTLKRESRFNVIYNLLAYLYIGCFVFIIMAFGLSPIVLAGLLLIATIFILPAPVLGLNIIIFMTMIFERWFTLQPLVTEYAVYKIYPLDVVIIMAILGFIISQIFGQRTKMVFKIAEKILAIFIIVNAVYLIRSFFDLNADLAVAFSTFKNYAFYPLLYFLTVYLITDEKKFKNVLHLILLTGLALIGFLIIGLMRGNGLWTEYTPLSTYGVRYLAGTHAFYLILGVLISIALLAFDRLRNRGFATWLILIWVLGIVLSLMRHLWLALLIGGFFLLILIPLTNRKSLIKSSAKTATIILTVLIIVMWSANLFPLYDFAQSTNDSYKMITERITSIGDGSGDTSINWRITFWNTAKASWLANPVFGLGFGKKLPVELGDWQNFEEVRNIHNSPLAITIQMGILGVGLFMLFVVSVILGNIKSALADEELKPYYLGLLACIAAISFASLFQPYFETNLTGIFFWIALGLFRTTTVINKIP